MPRSAPTRCVRSSRCAAPTSPTATTRRASRRQHQWTDFGSAGFNVIGSVAPSTNSRGWAATTPSPATATRGLSYFNATDGVTVDLAGRAPRIGTAPAIWPCRHRHRSPGSSHHRLVLRRHVLRQQQRRRHDRVFDGRRRQRHHRRPRRLRSGGLQQRHVGDDVRHHRRHGGRHGGRRCRDRHRHAACRSSRSAAPTLPTPMSRPGSAGPAPEHRQQRHVQRVRGAGRQRHHHRQRQHPDRVSAAPPAA